MPVEEKNGETKGVKGKHAFFYLLYRALIERDFENNKNINEKYKENKNDIIYNYNIISNKNDIDEFKGKNTFVKHINITNSQIKNMENIFDDFKVQTMEVK